MKTIAFFNNKGGVGKTTLVYHLANMLVDMNYTVIAADLDPQANLTAMFAPDEETEIQWDEEDSNLYGMISPLIKGSGDIKTNILETRAYNLYLLAGSLQLSRYEDALSETWPKCLDKDERAFRVQTAFARIMREAGEETEADFVLVDTAPSLGAINRAALIACDYVVTPLSPDLYSWRGLKSFGAQLKCWHADWEARKNKVPQSLAEEDFYIPPGIMKPMGYTIRRYAIRLDLPMRSFEKWIDRMPAAFRELLPSSPPLPPEYTGKDEYCIITLKDYYSLTPMAQDAKKPMFKLKPGEGAIGAHQKMVRACYEDFRHLADEITARSQD